MARKIKWRYRKNPHQKEFHDDITSKFLHLSGGFGSGKTFGLVYKCIQLSWLNKDIPGGMVAPDFADLEKDVIPVLEEIFDRHRVKFKYRAGRYLQFPWTKAKIYLASAKKRLRGPNWGWAVVNEVTLMPYVRYKEVVGRVRIKRSKYPQIASSGTPEGFGSEYHKHFIKKPFSPKLRVVYGSTRANQNNLAEDYIPSLESSFDRAMLEAYLDGLFVNMTGNRFYYNYTEKNEDRSLKYDPEQEVYACFDFNVQFMTVTFWQERGARLAAVDEIVIENNADTAKMCRVMLEKGYLPDNTIIVPDPSGNARSTKGKSDVQIIEESGFYRVMKTKAPKMRTRQLNAANLMEKKVIMINPDKCPTLQDDFLGVTQDPNTNEKNKENPALTHASDGADYLIELKFPFSGRRSGISVGRAR